MWRISIFGIIISVILLFIYLTLADIHNDLIIVQHLIMQFNSAYNNVNKNKPKRGKKANSELQKEDR